jgi:hypothetical protein
MSAYPRDVFMIGDRPLSRKQLDEHPLPAVLRLRKLRHDRGTAPG